MTPPVTCALWNPVSTKNEEPNPLVESFRLSWSGKEEPAWQN